MVQIVGTYKHVKHAPDFESHLKRLGVPDTVIPIIVNQKPTLTISENNGRWTFHHSDAGKEWSSSFNLGEPYDEEMFNGDLLKSITRREGDKMITESTIQNSKDTRVYEFSETGITVHSSNAKCSTPTSAIYKRM